MYKYSTEKVANAIIYFLDNNIAHFGKTKLMKLMFFTDKLHLQKYGRVVFFDEYYKYERGPVAHLTLSIINSINEVEKDDMEYYTKEFEDILAIKNINDSNEKITSFIAKKDFNKNLFSRSELKVFDEIIKKYALLTKEEISDISHGLKEYSNTKFKNIIEEEAMIENEETKDYVKYWKNEHLSFDKMVSSC